MAVVKKCEQVAGSELNTRTNVLLVRQNVLTAGNGVVFTYTSQKNTKKSHRRGKSACVVSACRAGVVGWMIIWLPDISSNISQNIGFFFEWMQV